MAIEYATWNPDDLGFCITLANGNLDMGKQYVLRWNAGRATQGKSSGKWYMEMQILGDWRSIIGYGTAASYLGDISTHGFCGYDPLPNISWGHQFEVARRWYQRIYASVLFSVANDDIIRMKVDLDTGWAYHALNDGAFDPDPVNKFQFPVGVPIFPMASPYYFNSVIRANFGQNAFSYAVPEGYNAGWYEGNGVTGHKRKIIQMRQLRK